MALLLTIVTCLAAACSAVVDWAAASPQAFDTLSLAFGIIDLAGERGERMQRSGGMNRLRRVLRKGGTCP